MMQSQADSNEEIVMNILNITHLDESGAELNVAAIAERDGEIFISYLSGKMAKMLSDGTVYLLDPDEETSVWKKRASSTYSTKSHVCR